MREGKQQRCTRGGNSIYWRVILDWIAPGLRQVYRLNYSCGVSGEPRLAASLFVVERSGPGQVADGLAGLLRLAGCRRRRRCGITTAPGKSREDGAM